MERSCFYVKYILIAVSSSNWCGSAWLRKEDFCFVSIKLDRVNHKHSTVDYVAVSIIKILVYVHMYLGLVGSSFS